MLQPDSNSAPSINTGNVHAQFDQISAHWRPHVIATLNNQHVRVAKILGEFVWHNHADEDEMFYVVRGSMIIEFRDTTIELSEGDYCVVPRGVEHRPVAKTEAWIMLFEPATTINTGNVRTDLTILDL
ncbi:MAG: cupin domain-containing protein [Ignavibacteria bacterium]|nr:cupin domain-containing protein [Ignavibacteria bacterium]